VSKVQIRRQWNSFQIASVLEDKLENIHWGSVSGGVGVLTPRPFIHAYVWCNDVEGEIAHSCVHGEGPHWIKVCIVRKDNESAVYDRLKSIADTAMPR
jgi:hypothetical protein